MKPCTTNSATKQRGRRILWFIGFYFASIIVVGAFYSLLHFLLHLIA